MEVTRYDAPSNAGTHVLVPEGGFLRFWVQEADGSLAETDMAEHSPLLLEVGEVSLRCVPPGSSEPAGEAGDGSVFGSVECSDDVVFVLHGRRVRHDRALAYLGAGLVDTLTAYVRSDRFRSVLD